MQLFAQMLPILQAKEALHNVLVATLAQPADRRTRAERQRVLQEWERMADSTKPDLDPSKMPASAVRARIESLGFAVEVVDE